MPLLEIAGLQLDFGSVRVVDGLSLTLEAGQILGLVGESGSGKSVSARAIARLLPSPPARYAKGTIRLADKEVLRMPEKDLRQIRGGLVGFVFQDPGASLNPVLRVGTQIKEVLHCHRPEVARDAEALRWLRMVGIPAPEQRLRSYPHELSGGMQQRVMLAIALAAQPRLLVADEPTTALDVTIQAQIIELLADLRRNLGMAILVISHNLGLVGGLADEVAVMYAGQIVEQAPAHELLQRPLHPYTHALIESVPALGAGQARLTAIPGSVPVAGAFPSGCRFHPRCPVAKPACAQVVPPLEEAAAGRRVRCPFWRTLVGPNIGRPTP